MIDRAALESCTRCSLAHSRTRVVVGSGPSEPALVVVGEAPGRHEDEGGEPFVGRSGQLLFRLLGEIGLTREECFVTNVVKCRPPANRTPRPLEIDACAPWFDAQLASLGPAPVLALGATAARSVFEHRLGIGVVHGRVLEARGRRGLATYHPAAALRGGERVVALMRGDLATLASLVAR
jgi:uracil-DNA glycosylase